MQILPTRGPGDLGWRTSHLRQGSKIILEAREIFEGAKELVVHSVDLRQCAKQQPPTFPGQRETSRAAVVCVLWTLDQTPCLELAKHLRGHHRVSSGMRS